MPTQTVSTSLNENHPVQLSHEVSTHVPPVSDSVIDDIPSTVWFLQFRSYSDNHCARLTASATCLSALVIPLITRRILPIFLFVLIICLKLVSPVILVKFRAVMS